MRKLSFKKNSNITNKSNKGKTKKQKFTGGGSTYQEWAYLPVKLVDKLVALAEYYSVSHKARGLQKPTKSDEGFLTMYRKYGTKMEPMPVRANRPEGENWKHHRNDFCSRRYSMIKGKANYGLYDANTGLPSVMHVNMLMWACSPDMKTISKNVNKYLAIVKKLKNNKK